MTQKIDDVLTRRKDRRRQIVLEEDSFAPEIIAVPLPKGFKQPMIEVYDGVTDLLDHLCTFVDLMRLYVATDAVMCRSFSPTLRREARDWVATLAPRSIKTFDELSRSFVAYFMSSKRKKKTAIGLMQVVQEKYEPLQDYLARFSRATLGVKDLQILVVVTALMNGTQNQAFKMSLSKNPPELMYELLKKGEKYVDAEEAKKVRSQTELEEIKTFTPVNAPRAKKVNDRPPPKARVINVIAGGITTGGDSNSSRKGYARTVRVCSI
ncbi:uncharacterized protein LOC111406746 [Olea europaea var. sylvestris]|uniref:uncharacterized protein LOC111406746 n=1 Tax=Olea europaea var. sylvestris TaxID=158386 RepID=UPI000C1D7045|nr:uncharacterized protein LOC111406746 [Olea europaea var. sylvestris]